VPAGEVRPTMDLVKGAIFSSLGELVPGVRVLDLFAGSGGLGIEALSRGAAHATFVEHSSAGVDVIHRNLQKARLSGHVRKAEVCHFLRSGNFTEPWDLIFADPPYPRRQGDQDFGETLLAMPELLEALAEDGIFILEVPGKSVFEVPAPWDLIRRKKYGKTECCFFRKNQNRDIEGETLQAVRGEPGCSP